MDFSGVEEIGPDECWRLLTDASLRAVGRLALLIDGQILILPVGFGVTDHKIVIRTHEGLIAAKARSGEPMTFEVDSGHPCQGCGWSVVARGRPHVVTDPTLASRMRQQPPFGWGSKHVWVRIEPDSVTGRRVVWPRALTDLARAAAQRSG